MIRSATLCTLMFAALGAGDDARAIPLPTPILGPDAAACSGTTNATAFLVVVSDFRNHEGQVRVRLFGGHPSTYFDRTRALVRTQLPVPQSRTAAICVPVPAPGVYALDVRHDVNGNDVTDRGDGGGISGNPRLSIWDVIFRRRPSPKVTQVEIAQGVKQVPIRVQYP